MTKKNFELHTSSSLQEDDNAPDAIKLLGSILTQSAFVVKDELPDGAEVTVIMRFPAHPGSVMMASTEQEGFDGVLSELLKIHQDISGGKQ